MIHRITALDPAEVQGEALQLILKEELTSALFFDIETTGLSADTAFVFLIGCICYEDDQWTLHQYMIRFVQEERQLLSGFFDLAGHFRTLIHFNGNHFDLPFLNKRAKAIGLFSPLPNLDSCDLYQRYRPLKKILSLTHMNQRSLETWVGWNRADELSGKDMIGTYWSYSVKGDEDTEQLLLGHNRDDLLGMLQILSLEGYLSVSRGELLPAVTAEETSDHVALALQFSPVLPLPRPLSLSSKIFQDSDLPADAPGSPACYSLFLKGREGTLLVPIFKGRLNYYFPDYKNYCYLPMEHQVIHKSVASFVDKKYREPATPQNCFTEKSGKFLPQPELLFAPSLRESFDSKTVFFCYEKDFCTKKEDLYCYVQILLKELFK